VEMQKHIHCTRGDDLDQTQSSKNFDKSLSNFQPIYVKSFDDICKFFVDLRQSF
jgi:hypothetical protein